MKTLKLFLFSCLASGMLVGTAPAQSATDSPDMFMKVIGLSLQKGRPDIMLKALPPSYVTDVEGLLHEFANRMDAGLFNNVSGLIKQAGTVLGEKKGLLLASDMFKRAAAQAQQMGVKNVGAEYDKLVKTLQFIGGSKMADLNALKTIKLQDLLATDGVKLMKLGLEVDAGAGKAEFDKAMKAMVGAKTKSVDGDSAVITIDGPHGPDDQKMTKVEGRWVPADMAAEWKDMIAEAKKGLGQMDFSKPEVQQQLLPVTMGLNMAKGVLSSIGEANTQQELQEAIGPLMGFIGMMMGGPEGGGPGPGGPGPGGKSAPPPGFQF